MRNNKSNNKKEQTNQYELPHVEPYHRNWKGGAIHTFSNRIGGAFGWSKKEWHRMIEDRNRKLKALKQKTKAAK